MSVWDQSECHNPKFLSFSPLPSYVYCSVLSVIVTWYLGQDLSVRGKVKGKKPQFPSSPANQPTLLQLMPKIRQKFKLCCVIHAAEGQAVVETIRWGATQYPAAAYGGWKPLWKLRSKPLWRYLCSVWFLHYQWMVSWRDNPELLAHNITKLLLVSCCLALAVMWCWHEMILKGCTLWNGNEVNAPRRPGKEQHFHSVWSCKQQCWHGQSNPRDWGTCCSLIFLMEFGLLFPLGCFESHS